MSIFDNNADTDVIDLSGNGKGVALNIKQAIIDTLVVSYDDYALNFVSDGVVYIPIAQGQTINFGAPQLGTGTATYRKSSTADPTIFVDCTLPDTFEPMSWLEVTVVDVTTFFAQHLMRVA